MPKKLACDRCRQMKSKCEWDSTKTSCNKCALAGQTCQSATRSSRSESRVEQLLRRVEELEQLLRRVKELERLQATATAARGGEHRSEEMDGDGAENVDMTLVVHDEDRSSDNGKRDGGNTTHIPDLNISNMTEAMEVYEHQSSPSDDHLVPSSAGGSTVSQLSATDTPLTSVPPSAVDTEDTNHRKSSSVFPPNDRTWETRKTSSADNEFGRLLLQLTETIFPAKCRPGGEGSVCEELRGLLLQLIEIMLLARDGNPGPGWCDSSGNRR